MNESLFLVSSGYDMCIRFWSDLKNPQTKHCIEHKDNAINALELSPSNKLLCFAAGNAIKYLNMERIDPKSIQSIDCHEGIISTILFPPKLDGCILTGGEDCSVRITDMRGGKCVKTFYHSNYVNSLAITNNNKEIIAADENGTIKIWDIVKGEVRTEYNSDIKEEGLAFRSISFAEEEGFLVGAKSNGTVCVFDYNNKLGQILTKPKTFEAHKNYITKCLISPKKKNMLANCSADTTIKLWERKPQVN